MCFGISFGVVTDYTSNIYTYRYLLIYQEISLTLKLNNKSIFTVSMKYLLYFRAINLVLRSNNCNEHFIK